MSNNCSQLFAPFRSLGVISNGVPFVVDRRGTENYVTLVSGKSFQIYHCAKLHLMFVSKEHEHSITAITSYKDFTITASGKQSLITIWHRGRRVHTFTGHTGRVDSLLMLGDHLLSTGRGAGRSLRLWNLSTMEPAGQLPPFDNDFSPSCLAHPATYLNKIVIGSEQGDIQLWNVQSKKLIYTFRTFADCRSSSSSSDNNGSSSSNNCHGGVTCMAQSPAVDVLGIGFADGTVCLHNMRADESIFSVKMTGGPVTAVTFRTDGRAVMATGGTRGAIAVWNLERRGELMALITAAHDAPVASLAFLEGEPVLVSAAEDNAVKMWIFDNNADPGAARLLRMRAGHSKPSTKIAYYGEGGRFLLSAAMDRSLRLFNIVRDQQMVEFSQGKGIAKKAKKIHKAAEQLKLPPIVDFAAWPLRSREWDNIITAHKGRSSLFSWNYIKKALGSKELESTDPSGAPFERVLISPCGNFAVGGAVDGWLEKFNIQSGSSRGVYRGHTGAITGIVTDSTGSTLITTSLDGTLRFWDFDACTELASVPLGMPASFLRMNRDNNLIAVATDDACVRIYDASTRKLARRFEGHTGHITDIAFSEDGRWLISAAADYTIRTWDLPSGKMVDWFATRRPATSIAFSPTGDFLATTHAGRLGIFLWANKAYFSSVILHRPPPLPTQLSLPSRAGPALQSGEESTAAIPQAEEEEEEEGGESESESESDAESESEAVPKPDVAAHSGYISLSELAPAKWQNIDSLDLIKERNRPIKAPEPVQVPFFMPTVPGLEPKFAPVAQEEGSDVAAANAKDEAKSKVLTKKTNSVLDTSSFTNLVTSGKYTEALEHLMSLSPSAVDFEFRTLPENDTEVMMGIIKMFTTQLESKRNFEVLQAYLRLFLNVHSEALIRNGADMAAALEKLLSVQNEAWSGLEDLIHTNLCMINYTTGIHT